MIKNKHDFHIMVKRMYELLRLIDMPFYIYHKVITKLN